MYAKIVIIGAALAAAPAAAVIAALPPIEAYQTSAYMVYTHDQDNQGLGRIASAGGSAYSRFAPNAQVGATANPGYEFLARMQYYFMLNGNDDLLVPMIAYTTMSVAKTEGWGIVSASLEIQGGVANGSAYLQQYGFAAASDTFTGPVYFTVRSNTLGEVRLEASAASDLTFTGSAFVDPQFVIDPAYAAIDPDYALHFSLAFSPGVANIAPGAVPEPAAWALMITGFCMTGTIARRRRTSARTVAG